MRSASARCWSWSPVPYCQTQAKCLSQHTLVLSLLIKSLSSRRPSVVTIGRATARSSRSVRSVRYSDRHETSGKRVSDDLQLSIFWRRKFFFRNFFRNCFTFFRDFRPILGRFLIFRRQNQLLHQILLQIHPSWGLYDQKSTFSAFVRWKSRTNC